MKIVVNTRLLLKDKLEGIGWFTCESLKRITQQHKEHEFVFLFDRPYANEFIFTPKIVPEIVSPPTRHPLLWYLWLEYSIPPVLKRHKADLFLSPDGYLSLSTKVKSLAVIHDLNFMHQPENIPFIARHYYKYYFPKFAQKADRIATVSEFSKNDICNTFKIRCDKIDVVYNGANENFVPLNEDEKKQVKDKYTNGYDYFVYVGALHPRKNIARLLQAFDEFKADYEMQNPNFKLVIIGKAMFMTAEIEAIYSKMKFKSDVIFVGRVCLDQLRLLIGGAVALTFVPYFEGFGIPIVEAMYCDTPVITSNITSMPEVGGDAVILVDPFSIDAIKNAMLSVAHNPQLRQELIAKAQIQRQKFSWQKTADNLWNSIVKCLESK